MRYPEISAVNVRRFSLYIESLEIVPFSPKHGLREQCLADPTSAILGTAIRAFDLSIPWMLEQLGLSRSLSMFEIRNYSIIYKSSDDLYLFGENPIFLPSAASFLRVLK